MSEQEKARFALMVETVRAFGDCGAMTLAEYIDHRIRQTARDLRAEIARARHEVYLARIEAGVGLLEVREKLAASHNLHYARNSASGKIAQG